MGHMRGNDFCSSDFRSDISIRYMSIFLLSLHNYLLKSPHSIPVGVSSPCIWPLTSAVLWTLSSHSPGAEPAGSSCLESWNCLQVLLPGLCCLWVSHATLSLRETQRKGNGLQSGREGRGGKAEGGGFLARPLSVSPSLYSLCPSSVALCTQNYLSSFLLGFLFLSLSLNLPGVGIALRFSAPPGPTFQMCIFVMSFIILKWNL